jgi:hypothetical protein
MTAHKPSKKGPVGAYAVGYAKPPKATQFQPGQSGNSRGRPRGRPSLDEILLEEIARMIKVKIGDGVVQIDKERALLRRLVDLALAGDVRAAHLILDLRARAQATIETAPDPETPLTEEELEVLKIMAKKPGK